jgi:hypothetical protein
MKLLLDTCVWGGAIKTLEASGHDVVWFSIPELRILNF